MENPSSRFNNIVEIKHPDASNRKKTGICFNNNYVMIPVVEKTEENFKGNVFNIEVKDNSSYVLDDFIVHNCNYGIYSQPNIFVLYAAAILEKNGYDVKFIDCPIEKLSWKWFEEFLGKDDSDAYAFYKSSSPRTLTRSP